MQGEDLASIDHGRFLVLCVQGEGLASLDHDRFLVLCVQGEDLTAYQIAFDLYESATQHFLRKVKDCFRPLLPELAKEDQLQDDKCVLPPVVLTYLYCCCCCCCCCMCKFCSA